MVVYSLRGHKGLDMTEQLTFTFTFFGRKLVSGHLSEHLNIVLVEWMKCSLGIMWMKEVAANYTFRKYINNMVPFLDHGRLSAKELMLSNEVLEKTFESPLDSKKIKPVNPNGKQPWRFTGRAADAEAEAPNFSHLMWRGDSLEKTLMLGKTESRRRSRWQDEMVGWHHQLNGYEFDQTPGDSEGQGTLACCSP